MRHQNKKYYNVHRAIKIKDAKVDGLTMPSITQRPMAQCLTSDTSTGVKQFMEVLLNLVR